MAPEQEKAMVLPVAVMGLIDVGRLIRELEAVENSLQSQTIRAESNEAVQLPKMSLLLDQTIEQNKLDLLQQAHRQKLLHFLQAVKKDAPRMHMSFSADPTPQFTLKLMAWLRQNIHPHVLLAIGLQPGIGAGCVLRTTNKYFDLSLSKSFADSRDLLMKRLRTSEVS